jgi:hypothetical protein
VRVSLPLQLLLDGIVIAGFGDLASSLIDASTKEFHER